MEVPPPPTGYYQPEQPPPKKNYTWLWIIAAVVGVCGCGGLAVLAAILFPVFAQARLAAQRTACLSHVKAMALGQIMYSTDWDDRLPIGDKWMDRIELYARNESDFHCPALAQSGGYGFAMEKKITGKSLREIADPPSADLVFEIVETPRNQVKEATASDIPHRHTFGRSTAYADGHAKFEHP